MIEKYKKKVVSVYSCKDVIAFYSQVGFWNVEKTIVDRFIQSNAGLKILDAGCGAGRACIELNKTGHVIYGIDISYDILKTAQINKSNLKGVHFVNSDLLQIPIKESSFDCIVSFNSVLGLLTDKINRERVVKEFYRILRKNGLLIFNVHNLLYPGFLGKRWIILMIYVLRNLFSKNRIEFGTRWVDETGQKLLCHHFTLSEIKKLLNSQFKVIEVFPSKGSWYNDEPSSWKLFSEDYYIVCSKPSDF